MVRLDVDGVRFSHGSKEVLKGVDPLLDEEAVRIISASPDWKPGWLRGKKVKSRMSLYVEFRLEKKGSFGLKRHDN